MVYAHLPRKAFTGPRENKTKATEDLEHEDIEDKYKKKGNRTQTQEVFSSLRKTVTVIIPNSTVINQVFSTSKTMHEVASLTPTLGRGHQFDCYKISHKHQCQVFLSSYIRIQLDG